MKYIKKYKLFENEDTFKGEFVPHVKDPIVDEIYEYLIDLFEDNDFEVEIGISWGLESNTYNIKYKDRYHLLNHKDRMGRPAPIRIIIHKIKNDEEYGHYKFDEVKPVIDRMVDILDDRFDCIVGKHESTNDTILYCDIILLPKLNP